MKKKILILTVLLLTCASTLIFSEKESFFNKNISALAALNPKPFCYSGGPGSISCSIEAGINIAGYGLSGGCSVACRDGFYACCTLRCTCEVESSTNSGSDSDNNNLKP